MKRLNNKARISEKRTYLVSSEPVNVIVAQLINIDFYPRMSEETLAFNATLLLQEGANIFSFECSNDGHGGCTSIRPQLVKASPENIDSGRDAFDRWQSFLSTQRDDEFYDVSEQMGWAHTSEGALITKSAESEVNNLLAEWCDKHNL